MRTLLGALVSMAVLPAYGSMIVVSGITELSPPPASLLPGALMSDTTIYGFAEQQGVLLTSPLNAGITSPGTWVCCSGLPSGTIPSGTTVNSYLLFDAPETDESPYDFRQFVGEISFSPGEKIVGIIIGYQNLAYTDAFVGAPGTTYLPASYIYGGLHHDDEVILGANRQSIYLDLFTQAGNVNMIRILTESPEPADFVLIGSGLIGLVVCRRLFVRHQQASANRSIRDLL
jgi:hypothetical protein